jgi:glycosyltransferase involved in cell wall biosynthesis
MVISSFMEGVPVVLMEAMAKELGVVSTRVGGVPELVEDGATGFLVDPGSSEALAAAIKRYAADPSLCRLHGQKGRSSVMAEYSVSRTASGMATLLERYQAKSAVSSDGGKVNVGDPVVSQSVASSNPI